MRIPTIGRSRRLRLAAGAALAIPAIALSTALGASASADPGDVTSPMPTPTPSPSPSEAPPVSESPAPVEVPPVPRAPVAPKAAEPTMDGALTIDGPEHFVPGKLEKLTLTVTSTAATTYRVNVELKYGLEVVKYDGDGAGKWQLSSRSPAEFQAVSSEDTATPAPISVYVRATDGIERTGVATGTLLTNMLDPEQGNNTPSKKYTVGAAGTVRGSVWHDTDRDGLRAGAPAVKGVPVGLFSVANPTKPELIADAETDAEGNYRFPHQKLGDYRIVVLAPEGGWDFTKPGVGTDQYQDSDVYTELEEESALRAAERKAIAAAARDELDEDVEFKAAISRVITIDGKADVVVDAGLVKGVAATPSATPSPTTAPGGGGSLPTTGAALSGLIGAGVLLVGGGITVTALARRRRSASTPAG